MSGLLLDTCAIIWLAQGADLTAEAREAIVDRPIHLSPISAWEVANLARKNRLALTMPAASWFRQLAEKMEASIPELCIDILTGSCALPGTPPNDPADRIIIATAREGGLSVVTRDEAILAYSKAGHVQTMVC
jgi:PIN domain nuclease of toxin-antitoxin system